MRNEQEVGGLRCSEVLAGLSDYLEGELGAKIKSAVDVHLAGCDVCERFGGEMGAMVAALRKKQILMPPRGMSERLRERLREHG